MSSNILTIILCHYLASILMTGVSAAEDTVLWEDESINVSTKCLLADHQLVRCQDVDTVDEMVTALEWIRSINGTIGGQNNSSSLTLQDIEILNSNSSAVIEWIQSFGDSRDIRWLTIRNTLWTRSLPDGLLNTWDQLRYLNLSGNGLREFDAKAILSPKSRLILLDLSHNRLQSVDPPPYPLSMLLLSNNSLETIKEFVDRRIGSISLANNPWNCNNELRWLLEFTASNPLVKVLDRDNITCRTPSVVKDMKFSQRLSVFETPVCGQCECTARNKDAMSVNCSGKGLTAMPSSLPLMTKIMRLENNDIKNISFSPMALHQWRNVTYLLLTNNTIESFVGLERTNLLKNLVALHMNHNRLREIPVYILDQLSHLDELYLSDNPWRCDCHTVPFQMWLQNHFKSVKDVYSMRCAAAAPTANSGVNVRNGHYSEHFDKRFANQVLLRIPKSELCPQSRDPIDMFEIINWLLVAIILLVIVKLIYDYFWQKRTGKLPEFFKLNMN